MPEKLAELKDLEEKLKNHIVRDCQVFSRVVGYIRPVNQFNKAKQEEFHERKMFDKAITEN